ncbi:MAG TPA: bifunctional phosphoribosylaminoimidazolecarboxamide formyltransferase/IMP cyclohydrolase [Thermodesulfobacteriota bacterium]|nr:bifunctional phosphoribosylaminoimidazolecarboxamide formyltransferase/IMP cyclohydrolase [Thermodesulfobacteriota bacterium]
MGKVRRAIISVSDKSGIVSFAKELSQLGVEILSTGGTAKILREQGIPVKDISEYTGFPEMLDGRVKTLHPKVHGGLLGQRSKTEHLKKMKEHGILPIDLVAVNLYPFEATVAKEDCSLEEAIENIDIGGPTMLRSSAKNYPDVTVLIDPNDYAPVLTELKEKGEVSIETNFRLAKKVFQHTARYDGAISNYLGQIEGEKKVYEFPETYTYQVRKVQDLRYGENPHQKAAFYREYLLTEPSVSNARQLQGKEMSFNNILDVDSAFETVKEFGEIATVIIKHNNPCGVATSTTGLADSYRKAKDCDPVSAFGGVVGFNRPVDKETAEEMAKIFLEVIIAPGYTSEALEVLRSKKDLRILQAPSLNIPYLQSGFDLKKVVGGLLVQNRDLGRVPIKDWKVVTKRKPTEEELRGMAFGWRVAKHVKSNAIVLVREDRTIGIGAGQMSRVDSTRLAVMKAQFPTKGTVLASDAMFPFRDGVDTGAEAGAVAIIQPGGSIRDDEVIAAADEHNIAMVFTGMRHFRH